MAGIGHFTGEYARKAVRSTGCTRWERFAAQADAGGHIKGGATQRNGPTQADQGPRGDAKSADIRARTDSRRQWREYGVQFRKSGVKRAVYKGKVKRGRATRVPHTISQPSQNHTFSPYLRHFPPPVPCLKPARIHNVVTAGPVTPITARVRPFSLVPSRSIFVRRSSLCGHPGAFYGVLVLGCVGLFSCSRANVADGVIQPPRSSSL